MIPKEIREIYDALYSILFPVEAQDAKINLEHHDLVKKLATMVWNEFVDWSKR